MVKKPTCLHNCLLPIVRDSCFLFQLRRQELQEEIDRESGKTKAIKLEEDEVSTNPVTAFSDRTVQLFIITGLIRYLAYTACLPT